MARYPTTFEQKWPTVILTPISVAGHIITVSDTAGLHTKAIVTLSKPGEDPQDYEIKRVLSDTQLQVGLAGTAINKIENPVQYSGGMLTMSEQNRNKFGSEVVLRAVYEEEPATAFRNVLVDRYGAFYTTDNPMPVQLSDGSINIGTVNAELEVQLSHLDNSPNPGDIADSVRIGDGEDELAINDDGSINTVPIPNLNVTIVNEYDVATSVPFSTPTVITAYTAPAGKVSFLQRVSVSGENMAIYEVRRNGLTIDRKRTYFTHFNESFEFTGSPGSNGLRLLVGDVIDVIVTHERPIAGDFDARIQVLEA